MTGPLGNSRPVAGSGSFTDPPLSLSYAKRMALHTCMQTHMMHRLSTPAHTGTICTGTFLMLEQSWRGVSGYVDHSCSLIRFTLAEKLLDQSFLTNAAETSKLEVSWLMWTKETYCAYVEDKECFSPSQWLLSISSLQIPYSGTLLLEETLQPCQLPNIDFTV